MLLRSLLLAVVALFGTLTAAEAQGPYYAVCVPGPNTTLGWNVAHIAFCATGTNGWFFAFFQGGGYGSTNNPGLANFVAPACQTGNRLDVYVTNLNPFSWKKVVVYPFK